MDSHQLATNLLRHACTLAGDEVPINDPVALDQLDNDQLARCLAAAMPARAALPTTSTTQDLAHLTVSHCHARIANHDLPYGTLSGYAQRQSHTGPIGHEHWATRVAADTAEEIPSDWTDTTHVLAADLLDAEGLPADTFERLAAVTTRLLLDAYADLYPPQTVEVRFTARVFDPMAMLHYAQDSYEQAWGDTNWHPEQLSDAVLEAIVLSNKNPSPDEYGFEFVDRTARRTDA